MFFDVITAPSQPNFAYFSMEIGLDANIPTYSGGLGVLAGDTLRAAADIGVPIVGVTLLHRKGYFRQHLDSSGNQTESSYVWYPEEYLEPLQARVTVSIEGHEVWVRAWRYVVLGVSGHAVPIFFLDTLIPENSPEDQALTDYLYGGDSRHRFCQEVVLGLGGVAMLEALGYERVHTYHMNEGHSALLTLALLEYQVGTRGLAGATRGDLEAVRRRCVFTTHTPVPAGHDKFPWPLVTQVLRPDQVTALHATDGRIDGYLNLTYLALRFARFINGVSMRHEEVSRGMFPRYPINSVTNGVHAVTWTSVPFRRLFDTHIPEWRRDNAYLRYAINLPPEEIRSAHTDAKKALLSVVEKRTDIRFDPNAFTIGFARRATAYKRADLLFTDLERLRDITKEAGPLQIVYSGKAHPNDESGKALIRNIFRAAAELKDDIRVVYLEEYDIALAKYLCSGVDLWLNTPQKPHEASGTSGMKAALNGVPSLSVLDGWWVEGYVEGVTGWAIEDGSGAPNEQEREMESLYSNLEKIIMPLYYQQPDQYARVRRGAIALNGSFFNAQRMMFQYVEHAYQPYT